MQGIGCYALKISMIEKTPTPDHRRNAAFALPIEDLFLVKLFFFFSDYTYLHFICGTMAVVSLSKDYAEHHFYEMSGKSKVMRTFLMDKIEN